MTYNPKIAMAYWASLGLGAPVAEYQFDDTRKWRFDFAWLDFKIALEVEGGVWTGGRHTRGSGFLKDMEKYNEAAAQGWLVFRTTPKDLCTKKLAELIRRRQVYR